MEAEKDKKKGFYFWLKPGTDEMINAHIDVADTRSRSQLVDVAIRHYCCVLDAGSNQDLLSAEVIRIIKATVKDSENHIASMLFKVAGEMALQSYLIGELGVNLSDAQIQRIRNEAYNKVRRQHGIVQLEDTLTPYEE